MFTGFLHLHITSVVLFLVHYFIKNALLLTNSTAKLEAYTKKTKVIEMIISTLFLGTGIYLWVNSGNTGPWLHLKVTLVFASIPLAIIGFKKQKKALALLSFLLLVMSYGIAEMKRLPWEPKQAKVEVTAGDDLGKAIYSQYCVSCHGEDGGLGMSGAKQLGQSTLDDNQRIAIITNGKGVMAGFNSKLTPEPVSYTH